MIPATNPFSTRHTRPGCIVPLDGHGLPIDVDGLLDRLRRVGGTAAIVGPHGSGKSTLLVKVADALEASGVRVMRVRLRTWRDVAGVVDAIKRTGRRGAVCVDSWECLSVVIRGLVRLAALARGCGLVVTTHHDGGMPVLARCHTSRALLESIVGRLPGRAHWYGTVIQSQDIEAAFGRRRGDIREALYDLYDVFELRSRQVVPQRS